MTGVHQTRFYRRAWVAAALVAIAGIALAALETAEARQKWYTPYLIAWLTLAAVSLGSISVVLLHNLTGGRWGDAIRTIARAAAENTILVALLSLPVLLNLQQLYPWTQETLVEESHLLQHKQIYLNPTFFQIRAGIYFAIWMGILLLIRWHERNRYSNDEKTIRRMSRLSGQGLLLHGLATTFAAIDWLMSLEPEWFSTIYGVMIFVGQSLAALAFCIFMVCCWCDGTRDVADVEARHDLGKLLIAFVMLWTYMSFSQFLIIWYGNLPEEVVWYARRLEGGWQWLALSLVLFKFVIPFVLLLSRTWKRSRVLLGSLAALLLVMTWLELVWLAAPAHNSVHAFSWLLGGGLILVLAGGWLLIFTLNLRRILRTAALEAHDG